MIFLRRLRDQGVAVFPGSLRYVQALRAAGLHLAVVSSSKNTTEVLEAAGLRETFDAQIDGLIAARDGLRASPHLTRSWQQRKPCTWRRPRPPCSRMPWRASKQAGRAASDGLLASIAWANATRSCTTETYVRRHSEQQWLIRPKPSSVRQCRTRTPHGLAVWRRRDHQNVLLAEESRRARSRCLQVPADVETETRVAVSAAVRVVGSATDAPDRGWVCFFAADHRDELVEQGER